MKKVLSLLLAGILLFAVPMAAAAADLPFTDVPSDVWFTPAVEYVYANGLFNGTSATTFGPNQTMNRAMFVQVLANKTSNYQKSDWEKINSFADVRRGQWYAAPVAWATKAGLANGVGNGKFGWNQSVTREQAAVFFYKYAQKTGNDTSFRSDALQPFADRDKVSSWAREAMQWAVSHQIIKGSGGRLKPDSAATRAEVAQFFASADTVLEKTVVDVEAGPEEPDYFSKEGYRAVIQDVLNQQNGLPSYARIAKGFFYDLDGDSVEELVMMYSVGRNYATHTAVSVYTLQKGKAIAVIKDQKLYDEVSAPSGEAAALTKGGKTYLGLFDQNGGMSFQYGMRRGGKWVLYTMQNKTLRKTYTAEFQSVEKAPSQNTGKIDGKSVSYSQYQNWVKSFSKKKCVSAPSGANLGGSDLRQLLNQL